MRICAHNIRIVICDKAYVSTSVADELWQHNRTRVLSKPRSNKETDLCICPPPPYSRVRQIVDAVNSQLVAHFSIETNHAPFFQRVMCAAFH